MVLEYFITGICIGIMFGMPLGAVGALSIQRTLRYGVSAGLISGSASSIADVFYACIGAFGLQFISNFLFTYQTLIHVIGGILLMVMAIHMISKKEAEAEIQEQVGKSISSLFLSSFAIAITNPAAILSFLFAFSVFGIYGTLDFFHGVQLVCGVFTGTFLWWLILVLVVHFMKKKMQIKRMDKINKILGIMLILCSIGILMRSM